MVPFLKALLPKVLLLAIAIASGRAQASGTAPEAPVLGVLNDVEAVDNDLFPSHGNPLKMHFLLKNGDIPASYVSFPEGISYFTLLSWES